MLSAYWSISWPFCPPISMVKDAMESVYRTWTLVRWYPHVNLPKYACARTLANLIFAVSIYRLDTAGSGYIVKYRLSAILKPHGLRIFFFYINSKPFVPLPCHISYRWKRVTGPPSCWLDVSLPFSGGLQTLWVSCFATMTATTHRQRIWRYVNPSLIRRGFLSASWRSFRAMCQIFEDVGWQWPLRWLWEPSSGTAVSFPGTALSFLSTTPWYFDYCVVV